MALFQPSNITPSSFAGGGNGVVDVNDPVSISWQVNGNSPMQAFKIAIYTNDAQSQFLADMPISTDGCPFYGTDSKGNFQTFQYKENASWRTSFGDSFENGRSYKIVITQYWGTLDSDTNTWSNSVVQLSPSVFITRDKPVIAIPNFGNVNFIKGSWTANYSQAQGDAVAWCRWQLAQGSTNNVIDDTGVLYTGDLAYEYNGLISDANYIYYLNLTVETENGVQVTTGWLSFQATYTTESIGSPLYVRPVADSSVLVSLYSNNIVMAGVASDVAPSVSGETANFVNGGLQIGNTAQSGFAGSVDWETQKLNGETSNLLIEPPYTVGWRGRISPLFPTGERNEANTDFVAAKMTDSVGGITTPIVACVRVKNPPLYDTTTDYLRIYTQDLSRILVETVLSVGGAHSLDAKYYNYSGFDHFNQKLVITAVGSSGACYYTFDGSTLSSATEIQYNGSNIENAALVKFYSASYLVIGGSFGAYCFSMASSDIPYLYTISSKSVSCMDVQAGTYSSPTSYKGLLLGYFFNSVCVAEAFTLDDSAATSIDQLVPDGATGLMWANSISINPAYGATQQYASEFIISGAYSGLEQGVIVYNSYYTIGFAGSNMVFTKRSDISMPPDLSSDTVSYYAFLGRNLVSRFYQQGYGGCLYNILNTGGAFQFVPIRPIGTKLYPLGVNSRIEMGGYGAIISRTVFFGENGLKSYKTIFPSVNRTPQGYYPFSLYNDDGEFLYSSYQNSNATINVAGSNFPDFYAEEVVAVIRPSRTELYGFVNGVQTISQSIQTANSLYNITRISITDVILTKWLWFYYGDADLYSKLPPSIDGDTLFLTDFPKETLVATAPSFAGGDTYLYKDASSAPSLSLIAPIQEDVQFVKIFSQKSMESAHYELIREELRGESPNYKVSQTPSEICMKFKAYYLIEAQQSENEANLYYARRVWRFGNNISEGAYSNKNTPNFLLNFTPYRLRQPTSRMGKSGTLQALLSNVRNNAYQDSSRLMDELFNLSVTPNSLFLKDMKGNLYMIHTSAPITQTVNTKSCQQQVTVSIPWEEVGDASGVSIIQLSTDENFTEGDCSINLTPIA